MSMSNTRFRRCAQVMDARHSAGLCSSPSPLALGLLPLPRLADGCKHAVKTRQFHSGLGNQRRENDVGRAILVRLFSAGSAVCHSASVKATFPTPPTVGRQHMAAHLPRLQSPANNHRNDKALICARPTRICYRPCGCATANRDRSAPRRAARGHRYCTNSASNSAPRCH